MVDRPPHRFAAAPRADLPRRRLPRGAVVREDGLDRILELLERRRLSPTELRVVLALHERDATIADLARDLGLRPGAVRRAGRRLSARGLVGWRHLGEPKTTTLGITAAGLATMRAVLTAADCAADEATDAA